MIRYALRCKKDHSFESWFASSDAYDKLAEKKQIACPVCGSRVVEKALMLPGVVKSEDKSASKRAARSAQRKAAAVAANEPAPAPAAPAEDLQRVAANREVMEAMRKLRAELQAKSEYVGRRFAEEARKIHHEEAPQRGIYGEATSEEAKALHEEGIEFLPLPALPEDHN